MTALQSYIKGYFGIDERNLEKVAGFFEKTTLEKGFYFTQEGKNCDQLSFIEAGYLRIFNFKDGKDITQWISGKGYFVTDLASLLFKAPSRWNIQALTNCTMYTIHQSNYEKIGTVVSDWEKLEKLFVSKCFLTLEDRVFSLLSMTAEERYDHLFQQDNELFYQVPQQYLASMLGMTPETFSRIRKKKSMVKKCKE